MNNSNNTIKTGFKVIDITGKMDGYVTLEEFMKKTEYKFSCDFNKVGNGFVSSDRVRVYHRIWVRLAPAKIKLDWNDDDAMPFVYYLDQKGRIQFGSSDERHPDLFNKMERCRFNYPHIWFKGRLWSRRKMIVFDQFSDNNKEEMYGRWRSLKRQSKFTSDTEGK